MKLKRARATASGLGLLLALSGGTVFSAAPAAAAASAQTKVVEERLAELGYLPGVVDGVYDSATEAAIWAYQKAANVEPTGKITKGFISSILFKPVYPWPTHPNGGKDRVEINLDTQLLVLYRDGRPKLVSHISSGNNTYYEEPNQKVPGGIKKGTAVTTTGDFSFFRFKQGWDDAELGRLYNAIYFNGGIAVHGSNFVPLYPDSHGCVRVPMHIAEVLPTLVWPRLSVYVTGQPVKVKGLPPGL